MAITILSMSEELVAEIIGKLPPAERRAAAVFLSQCSKAARTLTAVALEEAITMGSTYMLRLATLPSPRQLMESRDCGRAPQLMEGFPNLYAWLGKVWLGGPGAAVRAIGLRPDSTGCVYFAYNTETKMFLATIECELGFGTAGCMEFTLLRLGTWVCQVWREQRQRGRYRMIQLGVRNTHSVSTAKATLRRMYIGATLDADIPPGSDDHALASAMASRRPGFLAGWDGRGLRVGCTDGTKNMEPSEQLRCLHYAVQNADGEEYECGYAGVSSCLGMSAAKAACEWDERILRQENSLETALVEHFDSETIIFL